MRPILARVLASGLALVIFSVSALAREARIQGTEMNRFGRIALEFDRATKVSARVANGVLVIAFSEGVDLKGERLIAEMPAYIANVRRDPDRTGLRLALTAPFRVNVLEAGEKVFVDLLPANWTGLPPSLPPEVVAELARRAEAAEAKARAEALRREKEPRKPVKTRVASLPGLTRIVFEPPGAVPVRYAAEGGEVTLLFDAPLTLDRAPLAGQLTPAVRDLAVEEGPDGLLVRLALENGHTARGFREEDSFVVDVARPAALAPPSPPPPPAPKPEPASEPQPAPKPEPLGRTSPQPAKDAAPARAEAPAPAPPSAIVAGQGLRLTFPFARPTPAAAFERGGVVTLVFHTQDPVTAPRLPAGAERFAALKETRREGAFALVRLALAKPQIARLAPQDRGWVLTVGEEHLAASEPLDLARAVDETGRSVAIVPLAGSSGVLWLEDEGERIAVVTATGAPRGVAKPKRFVEFAVLPSLHGLVVGALADDLTVRSGIDGAIIARDAGLSLSLVEEPRQARQGDKAAPDPVIAREAWMEAQRGSVLERGRALLREAAEAPRAQRGAARMKLAQFYLANGLAPEAANVLALAAREDPVLQRQRAFLLLQGVAALKAHRFPEARRALAEDVLAEDPEGILWRALLDAEELRWPQALAGFRRAKATLDAAPDDLQVLFRLKAARAAIEAGDAPHAEGELTAAAPLVTGAARDEHALLRARLDEALGRADEALVLYRHLAQEAARPVAAEATLALADLGAREGAVSPEDALALLETLAVTWRGGDLEARALGHLGRLYAEAGRWREAFATARRANQIFADHPVTRALHDETARLFEDLFLSGKGDTLSRVDALALYFDFREFTPIGRRGDEIVRRLADRLVALDLLDQAGALLQHQVDHRLLGAARATVAARLATIRLMDGKPAQAIQVLRATRLPELPKDVNRARLLLEARALSDLSRTDLALEVLEGESGAEIERLRADILWAGRRWREAGEAHETIVGTRWQGQEPLSERDRTDLLRAAVAYALADDALSLDRLRAKFSPKMAESPDARTFAFLAEPGVASTRAFRDLARRVTSADTLADFLAEYRKRYPDAAPAERPSGSGPRPAPETTSSPTTNGQATNG